MAIIRAWQSGLHCPSLLPMPYPKTAQDRTWELFVAMVVTRHANPELSKRGVSPSLHHNLARAAYAASAAFEEVSRDTLQKDQSPPQKQDFEILSDLDAFQQTVKKPQRTNASAT